jgi:Ser/Thr protein kinase RdoA (MazF antagonist)
MPDSVLLIPRPDRFYYRLRARLSRPEIDRSTVEQILAAYDLDLVGEPQVPGGRGRSRSLILATDQGRKVLKGYKHTVAQPTIVHEHSILQYLAQAGFPAPRLATTREGETWVSNGSGNYALFDFIEGGRQYHNYLLSPSQVRHFLTLSGEVLADLHRELEGFVPEGQNPSGFRSREGDWWRDISWLTGKLAYCMEETRRKEATAGSTEGRWLLQRAPALENRLRQLDSELKEAALPRLIIHSDYGPYNLLFRNGALVAVLDFEIARLDWRISEFVYAFPRFAISRLGVDWRKMRCFLDAYRAKLAVGEEELRHIPAVWQFVKLRRLVVCWERYCESNASVWLVEARQHLNAAEWMAANQDGFVEELTMAR